MIKDNSDKDKNKQKLIKIIMIIVISLLIVNVFLVIENIFEQSNDIISDSYKNQKNNFSVLADVEFSTVFGNNTIIPFEIKCSEDENVDVEMSDFFTLYDEIGLTEERTIKCNTEIMILPLYNIYDEQLDYKKLVVRFTNNNISINFYIEFNIDADENDPNVFNVYNDNFEIVDETEVCAEALEEIYRNDTNIYFLPCIKSHSTFIKYEDGKKFSLNEAISKNMISINQLLKRNFNIYIQEIEDIDFTDEEVVNEESNLINNSNNSSNYTNNKIQNTTETTSSNNNSNNNTETVSNTENENTTVVEDPMAPDKTMPSYPIHKGVTHFKTQSECINKGTQVLSTNYETHFSYTCYEVKSNNNSTLGYYLETIDHNKNIINWN